MKGSVLEKKTERMEKKIRAKDIRRKGEHVAIQDFIKTMMQSKATHQRN